MRTTLVLLAAASLVACGRNQAETEEPTVAATSAAITYDGVKTSDRAALLAHGERISSILGCKSCHGENFEGKNATPGDDIGDMYAANVTLWLPKYSDAELDQLIRHGVPKDGRDLWWMPSENFQYLSDADFASLVAYLRTFEPKGKQLPPIRKGPEFLKLVKQGELEAAVPTVARFKRERPIDLGDQHRLGRYIAMTTCTECHNSKLQGYEGFTPDLAITGAYSRDEFGRLMTKGIGKDNRKLKPLMVAVAKDRFARLTRPELDALYAYLKARAEQPQ
jgi:mono/diheme cytochrome c family protein